MTNQLALPFTMEAWSEMAGGFEWLYVDQGPSRGATCSSFYTSYGIKLKEKAFADRICSFKTEEERKKIRQDIMDNRNLHDALKQNLLYNLDRREIEENWYRPDYVPND